MEQEPQARVVLPRGAADLAKDFKLSEEWVQKLCSFILVPSRAGESRVGKKTKSKRTHKNCKGKYRKH